MALIQRECKNCEYRGRASVKRWKDGSKAHICPKCGATGMVRA